MGNERIALAGAANIFRGAPATPQEYDVMNRVFKDRTRLVAAQQRVHQGLPVVVPRVPRNARQIAASKGVSKVRGTFRRAVAAMVNAKYPDSFPNPNELEARVWADMEPGVRRMYSNPESSRVYTTTQLWDGAGDMAGVIARPGNKRVYWTKNGTSAEQRDAVLAANYAGDLNGAIAIPVQREGRNLTTARATYYNPRAFPSLRYVVHRLGYVVSPNVGLPPAAIIPWERVTPAGDIGPPVGPTDRYPIPPNPVFAPVPVVRV